MRVMGRDVVLPVEVRVPRGGEEPMPAMPLASYVDDGRLHATSEEAVPVA